MYAFYQRNILTEEQQISDINPLYEFAHASRCQLHVP